jgi:hypothetical protein
MIFLTGFSACRFRNNSSSYLFVFLWSQFCFLTWSFMSNFFTNRWRSAAKNVSFYHCTTETISRIYHEEIDVFQKASGCSTILIQNFSISGKNLSTSYQAGLKVEDDITWIHQQHFGLDYNNTKFERSAKVSKKNRAKVPKLKIINESFEETLSEQSFGDDISITTQNILENSSWFNNPLFDSSQRRFLSTESFV